MSYKPTIGLEIHAELATNTKAFCGCPNSFGDEPNTNLCPVCLGLPGALPVLNEKVVELAVKTAILLNCKVEQYSCFDRKNYFYPDLVKGYQITQYYHPMATNGYLDYDYNGENRRVRIKQIHIEEDAGKSIYKDNQMLLDFNRSGVPLIEIVTEPDIRSGEEAKVFLQVLRKFLLHGGISHCKLEEGNIRVDANTSISSSDLPGVKTEIKNLNSFSAIHKAIDEEVKRQIDVLNAGNKVQEVTLGYDETLNRLKILRDKVEADKYMYFPEYDLPSLQLDYQYIQQVKESIVKDPNKIAESLTCLGLTQEDIELLSNDKHMIDLFYTCLENYNHPQEIMNLFKGEVLRYLKERGTNLGKLSVDPKGLCEFVRLIKVTKISRTASRKVLYEHLDTKQNPTQIFERYNLDHKRQSEDLTESIKDVLRQNPDAVKDYNRGKEKAFGYLMGLVMKKNEGFVNPQVVTNMLMEELKNQD